MINIKKLTKRDVGRKVILDRSNGGYEGKIVSWSHEHIYVKYENPEQYWDKSHRDETNDTTGIRTDYDFLTFHGPFMANRPEDIVTRAELFIFDDDEL